MSHKILAVGNMEINDGLLIPPNDFRKRFEVPKKPAGVPGICMEKDCKLPKVKGRHRCVWHIEAKLPPDERAQIAAERREAWDGIRQRGSTTCAGCGVLAVPLWYSTGSRCKSCSILDRRKNIWGIGIDQQRKISAMSDGKCYICGRAQTFKSLAIEHNHDNGEIRGLACQECNEQIGIIHDNPLRALAMSVYLIAKPAQRVLNPEKYLGKREIAEEVVKLLKEILNDKPYI
jgi:hypothetical protein